jgi:ATP:ADP antiporter, AAA family
MMRALTQRVFRLQAGEEKLVLIMALLILVNAFSQQITEITALSNFLNTAGVSQILIVWVVDCLVILLITGLQSLIIDRFSRISLMRALLFILGVLYLAIRLLFLFPLPKWFNFGLVYVVAEQQWLFVPLVFWVLANDIFDMVQAKRLFPVIASASFAGRLLGIGLAAIIPNILQALSSFRPEDVLIFNTIIYVVIFLIFTQATRSVKIRQMTQVHQTVRETLTEGWGFVREVLSFRYLMMAMLAVSIIITIIDFHFLVVTTQTFTNADHFQTFYSIYRLSLVLTSMAIQGLLTSRIISGLGLKNVFLILPTALLVSTVGIIALPGIIITTAGIALARLTQATTDESARKAFQALVPEERRGRVSMFMDSYLFAVGTIAGCVIAGIVILVGTALKSSSYAYVYLAIAACAAVFGIWAIIRMRSVYDMSLFNWRLKRRQHRTSVLDKLNF